MTDFELNKCDPLVRPMVKFFNDEGLKTYMSCEGHNETNMSMFWIEFDSSVTEGDILNFMHRHLDFYGSFFSCGRFAERIIGFYNQRTLEWSNQKRWNYFAATKEAAYADLEKWLNSEGGFDGLDGKRFQEYRAELRRLGKI